MRSRSIVGLTLSLSILLLAAAGIISFHSARDLTAASDTLIHTKDVSLALDQTLSVLRDAETGQRGFLLTGNADYLQPYRDALTELSQTFDKLRSLYAGDVSASAQLLELTTLAKVKTDELTQTIALRQSGENRAALGIVQTGRGKVTMDRIRALVKQQQEVESRRLASQLGIEARARDAMTRSVVATTLLAIAILAVLVFVARRNSAQIRASEEHLATTLRSIGDAVVTTDSEGRVTLLNPIAEALTGWSSTQASGIPLEEVFRIINEYSRAIVESPVAKVLREGKIVGLANHTLLVRRDGAELPIEDSAAPIMSKRREILGVVLVFRDASQLRAAERALLDADRRKDEFLATLAHELRNPLAPIRQAVHIAHSRTVTAAQLQWSHDVIERQVSHMVRLLDDLLDVSRITRGTLEVRKTAAELSPIVEAGIEMARPLIDQRQQTLKVQLTSESCPLQADPLRLAQVVCNLLTNAAKYTAAHGEIRLSTSRDGDVAVLQVVDNGIGLSPESLTRIFEMFVQVGSALDRTEGGLGIGLALAKGLTELHGGTIDAHSVGLGEGSRFTVRLPLDTKERGQIPGTVSTSRSSPSPGATPRRIVVADDNEDAAESLAMLLRMEGHDVHVVHDGKSALETIERVAPDMALLDIGMPQLNGYEVAARVREAEWGKSIALVAVTGWGQAGDRDRAQVAGFSHHLVKPVEPDALLALCRQANGK